MHQFSIFVSHSQIALFPEGLNEPFNNWTDRHVEQGFSWRSQSVSFQTLIEEGNVDVIVQEKNEIKIRDGLSRAILLPFNFSENRFFEIATISASKSIKSISGFNHILYETTLVNDECNIWISLIKSDSINYSPSIMKFDRNFPNPSQLEMYAEPA